MLLKALPLMEMTAPERRVMLFVLTNGVRNTWTNHQNPNLGEVLALHMDWNETSVVRAVKALQKRKWLGRLLDQNDHHLLVVGKQFHSDADEALERRSVRSAVGVYLWQKLRGDNNLTDLIWHTVNDPEPPVDPKKNAVGMPMPVYEPAVRRAKKYRDEARKILRIRETPAAKSQLRSAKSQPRGAKSHLKVVSDQAG